MENETIRSELSPRQAYGLLASDRRRAVVVAVGESEEPMDIESLASVIAATERRKPPDRVDAATHRWIAADLEETHLPELLDADVLRERNGTYVPGPELDGLLAAADAAASRLATGA